jgi:preprotein translocase subunit YajC
VVLSSGIHGSVMAIHEDIVTVQVDEGVRLKVSRAAIAEVKAEAAAS